MFHLVEVQSGAKRKESSEAALGRQVGSGAPPVQKQEEDPPKRGAENKEKRLWTEGFDQEWCLVSVLCV